MKTSHHSISVKTRRLLNRKETGGRCSTTGYSWQTRAARLSSTVDTAMETWTACPWASMSFSSLWSFSSSSSICCSSGSPPGRGAHMTLTCCCFHVPAAHFHLCAGQRDTKRDTEQWTDMGNGERHGKRLMGVVLVFLGRFDGSGLGIWPECFKQTRWIEAKTLRVFMVFVAWWTSDWHEDWQQTLFWQCKYPSLTEKHHKNQQGLGGLDH